jgi:hypothetical protein
VVPILVLFFLVGLRSRPGVSDRVAIYLAIFLLSLTSVCCNISYSKLGR